MKLTSVPSFRCSTPESRSNKKSNIFTWIPASSAGMTILLFAAQLNAAGVCIICPPGHTCPTGSAPTISGTPGQVLRRTATGTEWIDIGLVLNPLRDECNELRLATAIRYPEGVCAGRMCHCRIQLDPWVRYMPQCPNNPVFVRTFPFAEGVSLGCTGPSQHDGCWDYCRTTTHWRTQP